MIFNGYTKRQYSKIKPYILELARNLPKEIDYKKERVHLDLPFPYRGKGEALMCALSCIWFPYETVRPSGVEDCDFMEISEKIYGRVYLYPKRIKELARQNDWIDIQLREILKSLDIDGLDERQKAIKIHDYVCNKLHYCHDKNDRGGLDHLYVRFSKLLTGDCTVCNGYARLFMALCDKAGITCICVQGHDHEWNRLRIDGEYYFTDCTWDDGDPIKHTYSLRTKKEFYEYLNHPKATSKCNYWKRG